MKIVVRKLSYVQISLFIHLWWTLKLYHIGIYWCKFIRFQMAQE